jgi:hypothetical protein
MSQTTREMYRLSVKSQGRLYKALSHSVEEDESLFVMNRSPPRPQHIATGIPLLTETGIRFGSPQFTDSRAHHVHYHPSGALIVKAADNRTLTRVQAPPMPTLSGPFLMFHLSVAVIGQLAEEDNRARFADHVIDLSAMDIRRLQIECWVGPKAAFDAPFQWAHGPAQLIVYRDAAFYDVAYTAGEGAPIDPSIEFNGVKLKDTRITGALSANIVEPSTLPRMSPEAWASPGAVARQLRASLESCAPQLGHRLGHEEGFYEIRISFCNDGVIAAVGWNPHSRSPQFSFVRFEQLGWRDALAVVRQSPTEKSIGALDVFDLNSELSGGLPSTVFVRSGTLIDGEFKNALIFRGSELRVGRYWRIPPQSLKRMEEIIALIGTG